MPRLVRLSALVLSLLLGTATTHALDASHPRGGCPHVAATAAATGELRVVFLGGSITAAEGWRTLTTERLRQLFPDAKIVATDAGLPGTGSDLGACRVERDVLRHRPDLVFVEFAVNDASTPPTASSRPSRASCGR
ncbi:SGNH/GDSL hydrolase family protein [Oleiharenicola sp. Vm1]|uniref:SGNH/GDSL hydrolase family protein n=1 Tax=Oleiharenicola sp. Vm1 TaxID=3398393 RepID=UPI0039F51C8E